MKPPPRKKRRLSTAQKGEDECGITRPEHLPSYSERLRTFEYFPPMVRLDKKAMAAACFVYTGKNLVERGFCCCSRREFLFFHRFQAWGTKSNVSFATNGLECSRRTKISWRSMTDSSEYAIENKRKSRTVWS